MTARRALEWTILLLILMLVPMLVSIDWDPGPGPRIAATRVQIKNFMAALENYKADTGDYPSEQAGLAPLAPQYLRTIPLDYWNNPYVYRRQPGGKPEVLSLGADGEPGGTGPAADISSLILDNARAAVPRSEP